ncbi:hypothetical protein HAX54_036581 [Datura stramonium]|uniref:Uncharacterized protein n=1 Tax=Datura stramonium TaxID=4076 RepID=A0ABS8SGE3_DATST|nr:hypothetical protein [Datura stramonium]
MVKSTKLEYMLTETEMDAALQLIQLSGDSHNDNCLEEESRGCTPEASSSITTATLIKKRKYRPTNLACHHASLQISEPFGVASGSSKIDAILRSCCLKVLRCPYQRFGSISLKQS